MHVQSYEVMEVGFFSLEMQANAHRLPKYPYRTGNLGRLNVYCVYTVFAMCIFSFFLGGERGGTSFDGL